MNDQSTRGPGRPRDPKVDDATLNAAFDLLAEVGYARLSITSVALRAKVGKPAIYRRWRNKPELVTELLERRSPTLAASADLGTVAADLSAVLAATAASDLGGQRVIASLVPELPFDAELARLFEERFVAPRRAAVREIFRRGIARGELRGDLDLEPAIDVVIALIQHRSGAPDGTSGGVSDATWVPAIVELILGGAAVR